MSQGILFEISGAWYRLRELQRKSKFTYEEAVNKQKNRNIIIQKNKELNSYDAHA